MTFSTLTPTGVVIAAGDLLVCMDALRGQEIGSRVVRENGALIAVRATSGLYAGARGTASHLHRKNRKQRASAALTARKGSPE